MHQDMHGEPSKEVHNSLMNESLVSSPGYMRAKKIDFSRKPIAIKKMRPYVRPNAPVEEAFKNKLMTFDDIERLTLGQFEKGNRGFKPSDVMDVHTDSDDG